MSLERVVITGMGAVSPFGLGVENLVKGVWSGCSPVKVIVEWESIKGLDSRVAAPVPSFDAKGLIPRSFRRTMGPMALYAFLAAKEAVEDAGLSREFLGSGRVGVAIGSTTGSPLLQEEFYRDFLPEESVERVKSGLFFKIMAHSCAANVAQALGVGGEQWAPASACASAAQAMGLGYLLVKTGRQDAVLCGGADEVHPTVTMVFDVLNAASRNNEAPASVPRPFDRKRDGVVCGGGSGVLVLESLASARRRGAPVYGEILGFGHLTDTRHIANPHSEALERVMRLAIEDAGVDPSGIDYVNAHATGTIQGDFAEAKAIERVVPDSTPVSSLKGHLGHTLGAAGALESIIVLEMFKRNELVPTLHLEEPDEEFLKLNLIKEIKSIFIKKVVKNSFALGGVNTALVFGRFDG